MLLFRRTVNNTRLCSRPLKSAIRSTRVDYNTDTQDKNLDVNHAHFLSEAPANAKWTKADEPDKEQVIASGDDLEGVNEGRGKLSPTSSHLFKLILPLGPLARIAGNATRRHTDPRASASKPSATTTAPTQAAPPTVFLLHPAQPLSHIARLIRATIGPGARSVAFRSAPQVQWAESTDLGNFIRSAARSASFTISVTHGPFIQGRRRARMKGTESASRGVAGKDGETTETQLTVSVPTFADRTRFLQRRLRLIGARIQKMEGLKALCDAEARRGARKMALGGFGILIVYWGAVARLTFWDYGWDVMEPITYLSGLSTVVVGYLWFLYQGREVSYTSVLARSISARREALYKTRGFDIDRWMELLSEKKALRAEISRIARDYEDEDEDSENLIEDSGERRVLADSGPPPLEAEDELEDNPRQMKKEKKSYSNKGLDDL